VDVSTYVALGRHIVHHSASSPSTRAARHEAGQAFMLGIHHGLFCVGCCWTLMLLMFAVGVGNFGWMLTLGAVMAIEKNMPWGRRLSAPLGVVLLAWGLALLLGVLPSAQAGLG